MNYYTMLIKQGRDGSDDAKAVRKFITDNQCIGVGRNDEGGPYVDLSEKLKEGDVIVIRSGGKPLCLVKATRGGHEEVSTSKPFPAPFEWVRYISRIQVLGWNDSNNWGLNFGGYLKTFGQIRKSETIKSVENLYRMLANGMEVDEFCELLHANKQIILTGAPGTGKTYLARQIAAEMIGCDIVGLNSSEQFEFVQFHPSYDYTDFVEGLKPLLKDGHITFELKSGIFKQFCDASRTKPSIPHIFVIDEINRADLSRVFGELLFAIESGYRENNVNTQYAYMRPGTTFSVPKNVYIIGTMNDIDRSVESIDFALRRRFAWREIKADDERFMAVLGDLQGEGKGKLTGEQFDAALNKYREINMQIEKTIGLGESFKIGPAYFRKLVDYGKDEQFDRLWTNHLKPVLREYVRGMPDTTATDILSKLSRAYFGEMPSGPDLIATDDSGAEVKNT